MALSRDVGLSFRESMGKEGTHFHQHLRPRLGPLHLCLFYLHDNSVRLIFIFHICPERLRNLPNVTQPVVCDRAGI